MSTGIVNKGGRPKGVKDSKPRKSPKRSRALLNTIANKGIATGDIAIQNLEAIDHLINRCDSDREKLEPLVSTAKGNLKHNDALKYIAAVERLDDKMVKLLGLRQKWLSDIAKFVEYTKGPEQVIQATDGSVKTVGELLEESSVIELPEPDDE